MLLHKIFIILNSARNSVHFMAIKRHYTLTSMVIPGEPAAVAAAAVRSGYQTWLEWITMHRVVVVAYIPLVKTTTTPTPPLMFVCVLFFSVCMCVCLFLFWMEMYRNKKRSQQFFWDRKSPVVFGMRF